VLSKSFWFVFSLLVLLIANAIFGRGALSWAVGFVYIAYDTALLIFVSYEMLQILRGSREREPEACAGGPTLAVLITAKNEASVLIPCLNAIDHQSDLPDEVYWVDDGSTDNTRDLLENMRFTRLPKINACYLPHSGKAKALNQVWPGVSSEIIVTLDADTFLEVNALRAIRKAFSENGNLVATGGILTPLSRGRPRGLFEIFQRFEYIRSFLARRAWMNQNALLLISGAFAAYRKSTLSQVGGFDSESLVEDYDLTHRIQRYRYDHHLNSEVQVTVNARATTDVPVTLRQFLKQRQRWFSGFLQTHFKNGDMIGNSKYGKIGRMMLVIKSADTLQPIFGLVTVVTFLGFVVSGRTIPNLVWKVLLGKIVLDLIFHYGSVFLYYRWREERVTWRTWGLSTLATFLEPVSFQVLRHFGAFLGWIAFLRGRRDWTPQRSSLPPN
jgi:cellulose synthase/poly-beta-1,6-N-acetylglucosamine synthase-like glycosyltransferase